LTAGVIFLVTILASGIASSVTWDFIRVGHNGRAARKEGQHIGQAIHNSICKCGPNYNDSSCCLELLSILICSQVVLSLMIPLPLIPLVILTKIKELMGEVLNRRINTLVAIILAFNTYLIISTLFSSGV
jgi:manganese transport protein